MGGRLRLAAVALLSALLMTGAAPAVGGPAAPRAPGFTLPDLDGSPVSLRQLRRKGYVLLVFWSTQCPYCHAMIPDFKRAYRNYDGRGLTMAAVDVGTEDVNSVQAYVMEYDLPYLVLNDARSKQQLIHAYHLRGTPTVVLVAPNGEVEFRGHRVPDLSIWLPPDPAPRSTADRGLPGAPTRSGPVR